MTVDAKNISVNEFQCFCEKKDGCAICEKPIILIEQWLKTSDIEIPTVITHRLEGKSKDYIKGFTDALKVDPKTDKVFESKINPV